LHPQKSEDVAKIVYEEKIHDHENNIVFELSILLIHITNFGLYFLRLFSVKLHQGSGQRWRGCLSKTYSCL